MAGYHAFFSDWFKMYDLSQPMFPPPEISPPAGVIDIRGWDAVAFLLLSGTGTVEMADDDAFGPTSNVVTPVIEVDYGRPVMVPPGWPPAEITAPPPNGLGLSGYPFWLEVWRPTKRYLRVDGASNGFAFLYRGTGLRPPTPAPFRAGGRAS